MLSSDEVLQMLSDVSGVPPKDMLPETHLIRDLELDSVRALELLLLLEESLGREVTEVDTAKLVTVGDVIAYARIHAE